jgi:hypothetical protein
LNGERRKSPSGVFVNYWDATIPLADSPLQLSGVCLVVLREGLIARNEVFFDHLS